MLAEETVGEAELSLVIVVPAAVPRVELVSAGGLRSPGAPVAATEHVADVAKETAKHISVIGLPVKFPALTLRYLLSAILCAYCWPKKGTAKILESELL